MCRLYTKVLVWKIDKGATLPETAARMGALSQCEVGVRSDSYCLMLECNSFSTCKSTLSS